MYSTSEYSNSTYIPKVSYNRLTVQLQVFNIDITKACTTTRSTSLLFIASTTLTQLRRMKQNHLKLTKIQKEVVCLVLALDITP